MLRIPAQVSGVQRRVEMVGVVEIVLRMRRIRLRSIEAAGPRGRGADTKVLDLRNRPSRSLPKVELMKVDTGDIATVAPERMEIALPRLSPVNKFNTEFVRTLGCPQEGGLIDS